MCILNLVVVVAGYIWFSSKMGHVVGQLLLKSSVLNHNMLRSYIMSVDCELYMAWIHVFTFVMPFLKRSKKEKPTISKNDNPPPWILQYASDMHWRWIWVPVGPSKIAKHKNLIKKYNMGDGAMPFGAIFIGNRNGNLVLLFVRTVTLM